MKFTENQICKALKYLKRKPLYMDALEIVNKNTQGDFFAVGGMLYRNLAHLIYGGPLPQNYDFDFLSMSEINRNYPYLPRNWTWKNTEIDVISKPSPLAAHYNSGSGGSPRKIPSRSSMTAIHSSGVKIDIISISDIMRQQNSPHRRIETYFKAVPLDIQCIGLNPYTLQLFGNATNSIFSKTIRINNPKAFDIYKIPRDIYEYATEKTASIPGFTFNNTHMCCCDIRALMICGCKCGGI